MPYDSKNDLIRISKRLEVIRNLVSLDEDEDQDILVQIAKLQEYKISDNIKTIIDLLTNREYSSALLKIDDYLTKYSQVTIYLNPRIQQLKLEARSLEIEITKLSNEKADIEKLLHEFAVRHDQELGAVILKILRHQKEKPTNTANEQKEAETAYDEYTKQHETLKDKPLVHLNETQLKDLKNKYRKASKLSHPDVVSEEQKELATKIFSELNDAYERNDLNRVSEILTQLESGNFFVSKSESLNELQMLKTEIEILKNRISELTTEITAIKNSDSYNTVISIDNWNDYFALTKAKLLSQLKSLEYAK